MSRFIPDRFTEIMKQRGASDAPRCFGHLLVKIANICIFFVMIVIKLL